MRILVCFFLILCLHCEAQNQFNKRFDLYQSWGDAAMSLVVDSNSIWIAIATLPLGQASGPWASGLLQLDFNGNILDTNLYSIPNTFVYPGGPGSLNPANDGFILGGSFEDSTGNSEALLIRIGNNGDTLWTRKYGDAYFQSGWMAKQSHDGGFLLCGQSAYGNMQLMGNALLLKTDSIGNLLWQKTYGDSIGSELAFSFVETANGGYALSGQWRTGAENDIWIALIDSSGTMYWDSIIHNVIDYNDAAWNIINTSDGNLLVTGFYAWQSQSPQPYFIKLDLSGNIIWDKKYLKAFGSVQVFSTRELTDGSFISVGFHNLPPHPTRRAFLLKLSANGDSLWYHDYINGAYSAHELRDVYPAPDGGFVACGWMYPSLPDTGHQDFWVIRVDSMGCEISNCTVVIYELTEKLNPLTVFPVPFSSELNISLKEGFLEGRIQIFDATGNLKVQQEVNNNHITVKTVDWPKGIYFLKYQFKSHTFNKKIVKF
ncbi:MAG: T9SS type A sorting domain-containing protein [Bacteroidetes bacterium]|nr:MAG: T9SS type A sorting domain-containing protein [Bacteroidota bacterium]